MKKRRVFLVEDHPVFRLGLRELLDQEEGWDKLIEAIQKADNIDDQPDFDNLIAQIVGELKDDDSGGGGEGEGGGEDGGEGGGEGEDGGSDDNPG